MILIPHHCGGGRGTGKTDEGARCDGCTGQGFVWADTEPPTVCPASALSFRDAVAFCNRTGDACPGCGRAAVIIPTVDDHVTTRRAFVS